MILSFVRLFVVFLRPIHTSPAPSNIFLARARARALDNGIFQITRARVKYELAFSSYLYENVNYIP